MKRYGLRQLKNKIRHLKYRKRLYIKRVFSFKKRKGSLQRSLTKKPEKRLKKPLKFRSSLQILRKKLLAFYGFTLRRKPQRKIFPKTNKSVKRSKLLLYNNRFTFHTIAKNAPNAFETRIDVVLYRASFISSVREGKRFVREHKCFVMEPAIRKKRFFRYTNSKNTTTKFPSSTS